MISLFRHRRPNRRITLRRQAFFAGLEALVLATGRRMAFAGKGILIIGFVVGAVWAGDRGVRHVVASPRFAVREIRVSTTSRVPREELLARARLSIGDRLLAIDTDEVAARLAGHPWVAGAHVRRQLPGALVIDVIERRPAAVAALAPDGPPGAVPAGGALYLVDEAGRPFKRATLDEAEGLPVLTGVSRRAYARVRAASEAVFREALGVAAEYRSRDGRPAISEVHAHPGDGYSLILLAGGAEIRLGRGLLREKLAQLDAILGALGPGGLAALRTVHLDQIDRGGGDRVPVRLAMAAAETP